MLSLQLKDNPEHILKAQGFPRALAEHGGGAEALGRLRISHFLYRVESESFYEMDRQHLDEKGDRKTGQKICFRETPATSHRIFFSLAFGWNRFRKHEFLTLDAVLLLNIK